MAVLVLVACVLLGSIRRRVDIHRLAPHVQPGPTIHPPLQQHAFPVQQARTTHPPEAHLQQHAFPAHQARTTQTPEAHPQQHAFSAHQAHTILPPASTHAPHVQLGHTIHGVAVLHAFYAHPGLTIRRTAAHLQQHVCCARPGHALH